MKYKETAKHLAACGLTLNTFRAAARQLIYDLRRMQSQHPAPGSPWQTGWQTGFNDALRFLESEAVKVSTELEQIDPLHNPYEPGSPEWSCWNAGYQSAKG